MPFIYFPEKKFIRKKSSGGFFSSNTYFFGHFLLQLFKKEHRKLYETSCIFLGIAKAKCLIFTHPYP